MRRDASQSSIASRQERAASRILEDESLRGDLTDDEYRPLQEWAIGETDRIAASTAEMPDATADALIDQKLVSIREVILAAGAAIVAHAEGDDKRRASEVAFVGERWNATESLAALNRRLDAQSDLTGADLAAQIVTALSAARRDQRSRHQNRKSS